MNDEKKYDVDIIAVKKDYFEGKIKVRCKNLFCSAMGQYVDEKKFIEKEGMNKMICKSCGHAGFMPENHVLQCKEILRQIEEKKEKILWKDLFKMVNYNKMPRSVDQQIMFDKVC